MTQDIRRKQRFSNYEKAYKKLSDAVKLEGDNPPDIIKEGIIQRFEFTHELAWKVMKDYLEYEGIQNITGSRSATKAFFNQNIIHEGQSWMNMIESRNLTVHTYQDSILEQEFHKTIDEYTPLFNAFLEKMKTFL